MSTAVTVMSNKIIDDLEFIDYNSHQIIVRILPAYTGYFSHLQGTTHVGQAASDGYSEVVGHADVRKTRADFRLTTNLSFICTRDWTRNVFPKFLVQEAMIFGKPWASARGRKPIATIGWEWTPGKSIS